MELIFIFLYENNTSDINGINDANGRITGYEIASPINKFNIKVNY